MLYFVSKITVMVILKQILIQRLPGLVVKAAVLGAGGRRFESLHGFVLMQPDGEPRASKRTVTVCQPAWCQA